MIIIQKVTSDVQSVPRQSQGETRLTLTPSVISNFNYVITVGGWKCLKYCIFARFFYCNRQVYTEFLINLCLWNKTLSGLSVLLISTDF